MAATPLCHASSTDDLLANDEFETEKKQQYSSESPNHYDSDDTHNGVLITGTKSRLSDHCTGERIVIAGLSVAILLLIIYMGVLHHRMDRLETQCSSVGTFLTTLNKTQLNSSSELEDQGEILFHLSAKLENVADRISIIENALIQFNKSLSTSLSSLLLLLTSADEAASNNISDLQRSLGLVEGDIDLTKIQLQNLSSMYTDLQSDYNTTLHDLYTIRAVTEWNVSQLHDRIHQVEKNHSSSLVKLSRRLDEAAMNSSTLTQRIEDTLKLVGSQGQTINGIRSDVTQVQNSVTGLHGTLTTNVNDLNTRIDDHENWSKDQHSLILNKLSRDLYEAAQDRSMLAQKMENLVGSQHQTIDGIRSNMTAVQKSVSGLRGELTTNVKNLNARIDDHVDWTQESLAAQSQTFSNLDSSIERKLARLTSDAARIVHMPLGFLLLSAIVCYITL